MEELWEKLLLQLDTIFSLEYLILKTKKNKKLIDTIGSNNASVGTVAAAVHSADVVVLATPWNAARASLQSAGTGQDT